MLDYGWQNQSHIMLTDDETGQDSVQNRPEYHFYSTQNFSESEPPNFINPDAHLIPHQHLQFPHEQNPNPTTHFTNYFYDSGSSYQHPHASMLALEPAGPTGFMPLPKTEPMLNYNTELMINSRLGLGLNLGGRTYFSTSSEDDFVNRLYRRSRILEPGSINYPRCQAEGCNADLTNCKHYHRRHKVCEFHSKAATALVAGLTQRFCQQCSRFHILSEFDNGKRSCRRRLADHNRRRRKSQQQSGQENSSKSQVEGNAPSSSSENLTRSPHSPSVTGAISPPRISLDCYGYGSH